LRGVARHSLKRAGIALNLMAIDRVPRIETWAGQGHRHLDPAVHTTHVLPQRPIFGGEIKNNPIRLTAEAVARVLSTGEMYPPLASRAVIRERGARRVLK
jgi:hypothetical protein